MTTQNTNTDEYNSYPPGNYTAITGSLLTGIKLWGPFPTIQQAIEWTEARQPLLGPTTIIPIQPPETNPIHPTTP